VGIRRVTGATFAGSPDLNPWRSNNYDLSLEYYMGRATLFSIALFKLDIESFVTRATVPGGRFPDGDGIIRREVPVNMPVQGDGGSLQGSNWAPSSRSATSSTTTASSATSVSTAATPSRTARRTPRTCRGRICRSRTTPNSSSTPRSGTRATSCRPGSRTTTARRACPALSAAIPIYQDTSQYVDVNVTYDVTDNVTVYANGSNVFGEIEEYYLEFEKGAEQFHSRNEFEPRWSMGVRAKF
jgi:iron complex outermembrane receptor protein